MMARTMQVVVGLLLVAVVLIGVRSMVFGAERKTPLPAPVVDEHTTGTRETAVFAGGCFWGVQASGLQRLKGVSQDPDGRILLRQDGRYGVHVARCLRSRRAICLHGGGEGGVRPDADQLWDAAGSSSAWCMIQRS